jgi:hypothetical protein
VYTHRTVPYVGPYLANPKSLPSLLAPKNSNLEGHLRPFVLFSDHKGQNHPWPHLLHFLSIVWKGEVKSADERDQKCVYFGDTAAVGQSADYFRLVVNNEAKTYANLHPMQLLEPPENVALHEKLSCTTSGRKVISPTGYCKHQRVIQAFH